MGNINKKLLKKALDFERECQKNGLLKYLPSYIGTLDEFAQNYGFYSFDEMIKELSND